MRNDLSFIVLQSHPWRRPVQPHRVQRRKSYLRFYYGLYFVESRRRMRTRNAASKEQGARSKVQLTDMRDVGRVHTACLRRLVS
eukprot:2921294-Prymnesium_polylepis.1